MAKIATIKTWTKRLPRDIADGCPTRRHLMRAAISYAAQFGVGIDTYGRAFAKFVPSPPRGMRWQTGKLVPR
jgi:hypothetical protein